MLPQQRWLLRVILWRAEYLSNSSEAGKLIVLIAGILYKDFDLERVSTLTWCLWELGVIYIFHQFK